MAGTTVARRRQDEQVTLEDVEIIFRNFAGAEGQYNRAGSRNFCVLLEPELATAMAADGWNIKTTKEREVDEETVGGEPYLPVEVGYKLRPPLVYLITSKGRTPIGENEIEILDWVDIEKVDLIVNPSHWNVSGKSGTKAYLKTMFITLREDYLQMKYADVPIARGGALPAGESDAIIEGEIIGEDPPF
jgi:hypothetical protein